MTTVIITFTVDIPPYVLESFQRSIKEYLKVTLHEIPEYRDVRHPVGIRPSFTITVRNHIGLDIMELKGYLNALQEGLKRDGTIKDLIIQDITFR